MQWSVCPHQSLVCIEILGLSAFLNGLFHHPLELVCGPLWEPQTTITFFFEHPSIRIAQITELLLQLCVDTEQHVVCPVDMGLDLLVGLGGGWEGRTH